MDWGNLGGNIILIIAILAIVVLFSLIRRRSPERGRPQVVRDLLSEVRINEALVETFHQRPKPRRFETSIWQLNRKKLDFFEESLQADLNSAFTLAEDFNGQLKAAKKAKSADFKLNFDPEKMKESLARSKKGLEDWLLAHFGGKEPPPKYPSIMDSLFGGR
jgi:hypothetical protein